MSMHKVVCRYCGKEVWARWHDAHETACPMNLEPPVEDTGTASFNGEAPAS